MATFTQRVNDRCSQEWSEAVCNSSKLTTYSTFKPLLESERYPTGIYITKFRKCLTKFRCVNHNFELETGRSKM